MLSANLADRRGRRPKAEAGRPTAAGRSLVTQEILRMLQQRRPTPKNEICFEKTEVSDSTPGVLRDRKSVKKGSNRFGGLQNVLVHQQSLF